jgi:hypothetical protein
MTPLVKVPTAQTRRISRRLAALKNDAEMARQHE